MARERKLTGREAFNRLFWDARVNRDAFVMGYTDRRAEGGTRETPLPRWDPQGLIPWHRLLYIRCGDLVVWSRNGEEDYLDSRDLPPEAWATPPVEGGESRADPGVRARAVYQVVGQGWEAVASTGSPGSVPRLTIATWNILADRPGDPPTPPPDRLSRVARQVGALGADIVALQEVTPVALVDLLEIARVGGWFVSEPPGGPNLDPHG